MGTCHGNRIWAVDGSLAGYIGGLGVSDSEFLQCQLGRHLQSFTCVFKSLMPSELASYGLERAFNGIGVWGNLQKQICYDFSRQI